MALAVPGPIVAFVVGLLVGGLAIFVGGRIVTGRGNYASAVVTALVGAVVWALAEALLSVLPAPGADAIGVPFA